jgi:hypothetical protein
MNKEEQTQDAESRWWEIDAKDEFVRENPEWALFTDMLFAKRHGDVVHVTSGYTNRLVGTYYIDNRAEIEPVTEDTVEGDV